MAVDIKYAVKTAVEHAQALLGNVQDVRLEEVEPGSNDAWLITVSFASRDPGFKIPLGKREYKQIEVNSFGQPIAMRIRTINGIHSEPY